MEVERRKHRTPFHQTDSGLADADGRIVARCASPDLAHFLGVAANSFDELTQIVDICIGEYELLEDPESRPGYRALKQFRHGLEQQLRG